MRVSAQRHGSSQTAGLALGPLGFALSHRVPSVGAGGAGAVSVAASPWVSGFDGQRPKEAGPSHGIAESRLYSLLVPER